MTMHDQNSNVTCLETLSYRLVDKCEEQHLGAKYQNEGEKNLNARQWEM